MFVLSNLFAAIAEILHWIIWLYIYVVVARALISWVSPDPYNPIVQFLYRVTEPVLEPVRSRLPAGLGIDFSPMIVILLLYFLDMFLVRTLHGIAVRLPQ